jgi:hypothetical protein
LESLATILGKILERILSRSLGNIPGLIRRSILATTLAILERLATILGNILERLLGRILGKIPGGVRRKILARILRHIPAMLPFAQFEKLADAQHGRHRSSGGPVHRCRLCLDGSRWVL